jgi:uncharacterized damage-inducible protein DinB
VNQRLQQLICDNLALLDQALDLLDAIDDADYDRSPLGFEPHRIGGHLRHCLEFYGCFLDGVSTGLADYDSRRRDARVEHEKRAATQRVIATIDRLSTASFSSGNSLWARVEGSAGSSPVQTSAERELGFLLSHTIHHFALIAMTMRALGLPVDPAFGVSPSTLRHRAEEAVCVR